VSVRVSLREKERFCVRMSERERERD
jgi:hypothetical protein